jgi:hypothetical protein
MYLGGLRDLVATDVIDDPITIDRQRLHSLIQPAFQKAEALFCDLNERLGKEPKPASEEE